MKKAFFLTSTMIALFCFLPSISYASTATLRWQSNTETDLAGYKIYYGTTSRKYGAPITVGKVNRYDFTGLNSGTYYFTLTAIDTAGNESGFSREVTKTISPSPTPPPPLPSGGSAQRIGADFNGDGSPDILWRDYSTGRNYVWFMDGTKRMGTAELESLPDLSWRIVGTGDFNRDGSTDILWRNYSTGKNMVWLMNRTSRSSVVNVTEMRDLAWRIEGTGDFNRDGSVDILWRNYRDGSNMIWLMSGTSYRESINLTPIRDLNWRIVGTGDFSKNGSVDILWRHHGTGNLSGSNAVWLMSGTTVTSGVYLNYKVQDLGWRIVGTGDFNKDGSVDILWRHYGTGALGGSNAVWFMNGTNNTRGVYLDNNVSNIKWESLS
jgi:hypothetical protein